MKVYLAGPIQGYESKQDYRVYLAKILSETGHKVQDPWEDEGKENLFADVDYEVAKDLMKKRLSEVESCDALLAFFPRDSVGTAIEAMYAKKMKKTVIVICPMKRPSPWIIALSKHFFTSIEEFEKSLSSIL